MILKSKLDSLSEEDRQRLFYAFDHGFGQYIKISDTKFVGVNITEDNYRNFIIEEELGRWSYGTIK